MEVDPEAVVRNLLFQTGDCRYALLNTGYAPSQGRLHFESWPSRGPTPKCQKHWEIQEEKETILWASCNGRNHAEDHGAGWRSILLFTYPCPSEMLSIQEGTCHSSRMARGRGGGICYNLAHKSGSIVPGTPHTENLKGRCWCPENSGCVAQPCW